LYLSKWSKKTETQKINSCVERGVGGDTDPVLSPSTFKQSQFPNELGTGGPFPGVKSAAGA
jgi:hypothetical protein